jgi:peroxiredoxin (alkyl hydroperoxide reductase subunit C)
MSNVPVLTVEKYTTLVTRPAPDFTADAVMPDNTFDQLTLSKFKGKYILLFFYPLDFTFVCPSEILAFNKKVEESKKRNCEVIGVSIDSKFTHLAWKNTPVNDGGIVNIQYPIVSDITKNIARSYGILANEAVALRALFLIDTKGMVRHATINDLPLGRSVDEALRTLSALEFVETHGDQVCPANWKEGADAMEASSKGVAKYLSKHA